MKTRTSKSLGYLFTLTVALGLAGCEAPRQPADFRDAFPVSIEKETVSTSITVTSGAAELSPGDRSLLNRFTQTYHARGEGYVAIQTSQSDGGDDVSRARIEAVRGLLVRAGIRGREIAVLPAGSNITGNSVVLSFTANFAEVPECGDWSSESGFNWSNRRHSNFGCSFQRNIGLTVANPGDLKTNQPMTGYSGQAGARIVGGHRTGTAGTASE